LARVELAPEVGEDLDRILEHLERHEAAHVAARVREIIDALGVLETSPLIGRPARNDKRELVIGRGPHGYVALYRHVPALDTVFVLAVRGQREAGFSP
jgi:plasmid stabilization system protein ParE